MAEEKAKVSEKIKTTVKILLGIVLIALGLWGIWTWRLDVLTLIKGSIGFVLVLAGVISIAIARP
jgi:hypothetical protein